MEEKLGSRGAFFGDVVQDWDKEVRKGTGVLWGELILVGQHLGQRPEAKTADMPQLPLPVEELP